MKKLSFLILTILSCLSFSSGWAQGVASHFTLAHDGESGSRGTTIYIKLDLGEDPSADPTGAGGGSYWYSPREYEVAAFIDDECYALSLGTEPNMDYADPSIVYNWFPLTVYSYNSTDRSKNLSFKVFNHNTGIEYNLAFDGSYRILGVNYGSTTSPVEMKVIEPSSMSLDFDMYAGSTESLDSKLTFTPANATCPNNLYWRIDSPNDLSSDYDLDGNQFTPHVTGTFDVYGWAGDYNALFFRDGSITVNRAPNAVTGLDINSGYETLFIPVGDAYTLGDELARALSITWRAPYEPGDEYPEWVSSNESVVGFDATGRLTPFSKGSCTLTAQVYNADGSVRLSASVTVRVGTFVTYINMLHSSLQCIVGEDLTSYLPRTFEIQPAAADDNTVTYTVIRGDGVLEKRADGHIVAVGEGVASVQITANDGAGASASLTVSVQNMKNVISVKEKTLTIVNNDNVWPQDISDAVSGNVSFLPADGYFGLGEPTYSSGSTDVVTIEQSFTPAGLSELVANGLKVGSSVITVRLEVPDLLEESLASVGQAVDPRVVTETFTVNMIQTGPTAISLPARIVVNYGENLDLTKVLALTPNDAEIDWSDVVWTFDDRNWDDYVSIDRNVLTTVKPTGENYLDMTAAIKGTPLSATTRLYVTQAASGLSVRDGYETVKGYVGIPDAMYELSYQIFDAFVITPANSTDKIVYKSADESIVSPVGDYLEPVKGGETTVTAYLYDLIDYLDNGDKATARFQKSIKVVVIPETEGLSIPKSITVKLGDKLDLTTVLKALPEGAEIDWSQVEWSYEEYYKDYFTIKDNILTTLKPALSNIALTATLGDLEATTKLNIPNPATGLAIADGHESITVFKGDWDVLTPFVEEAFIVTPKNTTDELNIEIEDEDIVEYDRTYVPVKAGTTKIWGRVYSYEDWIAHDMSKPLFEKYITVTVQNRAEKIGLPERLVVKLSETLDLTTVLSVDPEDAVFDYSKLVWNHSKTAGEYFGIEDNILKPLKPGMYAFGLEATVPDTKLKAATEVYVSNPAKNMSVREGYEKVTVHVYEDEALTTRIKEAFMVDPANFTDQLVLTIDNDDIIMADPYRDGNYMALKPGSTTVTATIYDYFDESHAKQLFQKSITVEVLPAVDNISIREKTVMNEGETLNLDDIVELTVDPNLNYHKANLIWTVEKGKESLVSIDENRVLTALSKGVLTLTASVPDTEMKASTELTILRPATEMSIVNGFETVYVCVGTKRLPSILEDGLLVRPLGYTDEVEWAVADDGILEVIDGVLTPVKTGITKVHAYIGDKSKPRLQTGEVTVEVGLQITGVAAKEPLLNYCNDVFRQREPITQDVKDNFILTPDARLVDYNPRFVSSNEKVVCVQDLDTPDEDGVRPIYVSDGIGTATITVTITVPDYNNPSSRNGKPKTKDLTASFDIEVEQGLQGLQGLEMVELRVGETYELKLRTIPENVKFDFDPAKMELAIEPNDSREFPDDWTYVTWRQKDGDPLTFYLDAKCVGKGYIWAIYDGVTLAGGGAPNMQVTPRYTVGNGWQWFALYDGAMENLQEIKDIFCNKLIEVRARDGILVNDPELGYMGDIKKIAQGETYKLYVKDVPGDGYSFTIAADQYASLFTGKTIEVKAGWNWIGNPYQYCQPIKDVFKGNTFTQGDMICSQDAYATWDGSKWVGKLTHLTPGQGLLLMLNKAGNIKLNDETTMEQILTAPAEHSDNLPVATAGEGMDRFHSSTVYYINVQDSKGKSMNNDMAETCIQAYVGDELRGMSKRWSVDTQTGQTVFVVRVWGQEGDADNVSFCAYYGEKDKEAGYHLGTQSFHGGIDESVGTPGKPLDMTLIPITGIVIEPSLVGVKKGETTTVTTKLLPENHNEIEKTHTGFLDANYAVWYTSSNDDIFKVGKTDGVITGVNTGESQLNASFYYVAEKNGEPWFIELLKTFTTVTVTDDDIPVTSIRNDMVTTQLQRELGTDFILAFTVLPEYATNRKVHYEVGDENIITYTTDINGDVTFKGIKTGRTTITVVSDFNQQVKLTYTVEIIYGSSDGHVIAITPKNDIIETLVGEIINPQLLYTVYPDNALDKSVSFKVVNGKDGTVLEKLGNGDIEAVRAGESQVRIISNDNSNATALITVKVYEPQEATAITIPDELTLSKVEDVMMHLTLTPSNATIDPAKLEFFIGESQHDGWGKAATVTSADKTGRNWQFTGHYVGDYTYSVTYNGQVVKTDKGRNQGILHIPADYRLEDGWHWMSLYAVPSTGGIALKQGDKWIDALTAGENSRVCEIRSQDAFMHYDWEYGFFGTLTELRPVDGCFKVYVYNDIREKQKMVLSAGSSGLVKASSLTLPKVVKGYTWVTYPHEFNHTLNALSPWLKNSASEGDRIISSDGFIEYIDGKWIGDNDFVFEAGRGYIYYTEDDIPKTIDWGPEGLAPERAASRSVCRYSHSALSPETMPVVLSAENIPQDYTVAAIVGDECRGIARPATDGLLHLSVAGNSGETVTLRLINKFTGEMSGDESTVDGELLFGNKAGTHREPLLITTRFITPGETGAQGIYDLQGRPVNTPVTKGISIMNGKKYIK